MDNCLINKSIEAQSNVYLFVFRRTFFHNCSQRLKTVKFMLNNETLYTVKMDPSDVGTGGAIGPPTPPLPIFGRSVNPIPTGGGQIIPIYYYWHPQSFSPSGSTA